MSLDYGFVGGTLRKESIYSLIGKKKCFLPLFVFFFYLFFLEPPLVLETNTFQVMFSFLSSSFEKYIAIIKAM